MDKQPEHGAHIVQLDRPFQGHYPIGMRDYYQIGPFEQVVEYYRNNDIPGPDFWWIYAKDFPLPDNPDLVPAEQSDYVSFFPPPWNISENPEKTEGWIEFQRYMRKDPKYYLADYIK